MAEIMLARPATTRTPAVAGMPAKDRDITLVTARMPESNGTSSGKGTTYIAT
jgi:hypothetical protein